MPLSIDDLMKAPTLEESNPDRISPEYRVGEPRKTKKHRIMRGVPWNLSGVVAGLVGSGVSTYKLYSGFSNKDLSYLWICPLILGLGGVIAAGVDWYKKYNKTLT